MIPSRLFRNIGLPPPLRSLITPHPSLPAPISVLLRFRLGISQASRSSIAGYATTPSRSDQSTRQKAVPNENDAPGHSSSSGVATTPSSQPLPEKMEPRLSITFTCTVAGCGERSSHQFTKHAYEKGVVLVQCPGCKNRHLIADHMGWFKESTQDGKMRTIEDLIRAKGEKVTRGRLDASGVVEYSE